MGIIYRDEEDIPQMRLSSGATEAVIAKANDPALDELLDDIERELESDTLVQNYVQIGGE